MSGSEFTWSAVDETVESQIRLAEGQDGADQVAAELRVLRDRLTHLHLSGAVPPHPAERYDRDVEEALMRVAPGGKVYGTRRDSAGLADFVLEIGERVVHVETKWRAEQSWPFRGSTLGRLITRLPDGGRLLVVVNAMDASLAQQRYQSTGRVRVRIVPWLSDNDDRPLAKALDELVDNSEASTQEATARARA